MRPPEANLVDFFQASPLSGVELDLERAQDTGREVDRSTAFDLGAPVVTHNVDDLAPSGIELVNPWPEAG